MVSNKEGAEFEEVICDYVDAVAIAKKIKNARKRAVLIHKALGYSNWEIAINLGVSERTIGNYIKSIKEFLLKVLK